MLLKISRFVDCTPAHSGSCSFLLQILEPLLEVRPFIFALDVAALASRREYLNLDKWLADNINQHGAEFLHAVIEFLELKAQNEKITRTSDPSAETRTMALSPQTIAIFLRVLRNKFVISEPLVTCLLTIYTAAPLIWTNETSTTALKFEVFASRFIPD